MRQEGSDRALIIDPGEEPERILAPWSRSSASGSRRFFSPIATFDHIGAVAPVAAATGAPVYCPAIETAVFADIMAFVPFEGFGPYESYAADEQVAGGEIWSWLDSSST